MINNWNLDRGIQEQDETALTWKAVTTGNYGAIDIWLTGSRAGRLAFRTMLVSGEVAIGDLGIEEQVLRPAALSARSSSSGCRSE